jgi:alanine racemase
VARTTFADLSAAALRHNAGRVRSLVGDARVMACVKADAYGHGASLVAPVLADCVDAFAVACLEEALALRGAGIAKPVLLLEGPHAPDEIAEAAARSFVLCISEPQQLDWLRATAPALRPCCWLGVDTGMHRLGFAPDRARDAAIELKALNGGAAPVLATHFASADEAASRAVQGQIEAFEALAQTLEGERSLANSAAVLQYPQTHADWVRPGYMLYGGNPLRHGSALEHDLQAVMELSAEIIAVRELPEGTEVGYGGRWRARRASRIATIAAGYGDGYPRHAPDGTPVKIGRRCSPLAGRVSMDMITVDVTDNPEAVPGQRATLWGVEPGVDEIAARCDSIGYELLASLPSRATRRLIE